MKSRKKSKPKTAQRASVVPTSPRHAGDIVELLPPDLACAAAMYLGRSELPGGMLSEMNLRTTATPEQRESSRKAWERGRKAWEAARRVIKPSPEGRPRKDKERSRVRELRTEGKTWGEIQIQMNRETGQSKSKDAWRALTRKSK